MMKEIRLDGVLIKYQITFKKNKNTYFYFNRLGYVQINASKKQKEKDIIKFMKSNSESFIKKHRKTINKEPFDDSYKIWSIEYNKTRSMDIIDLTIDQVNHRINEPDVSIDHLDSLYKTNEKIILLNEAEKLKEKYLNNALIDISGIILKTRYTTSRFGSCNFRLKTINLNLKLVHYDKLFLEYIFLHEIAHLVHQNHSKDFYNLLGKICPNYKELKIELNRKFKR